jgi:hypothetical protein
MNPDTRVAICCYAGDMHQVVEALGVHLHHECPVVVLSPEDAKAEVNYPGIENRFVGKRAYIGQESLDRQRGHLETLLTFPENHFLINDSDSGMLDPKIPDYLYAEPDIVWSNQIGDGIPEHQAAYPEGFPHIAFQPPYFLSRQTIEAMLSVADDPRCRANPTLPFIDHYMVQLTLAASLPWQRLRGANSFPISINSVAHPNPSREQLRIYAHGLALALNAVRHEGMSVVHSVKDGKTWDKLMEARRQYIAEHPEHAPRATTPPRIR